MSSAEKQPNGTWKGVARVFGLPKRAKHGFTTKLAALKWADAEEALMQATKKGSLIVGSLEQALTRFRDEVSPTRKGNRWEQVRINAFINGHANTVARLPVKKAMAKIMPAEIEEWAAERLEVVSGATVRRELNLLDKIFDHARRKWKMVEVNIMKDVDRPAGSKPRTRVMSDGERDRICLALGYDDALPIQTLEQQTAAVMLLALETMMRSGEMLSLTRDQIFLRERYVHLAATKNGDERDVPLSKRAVFLIEKVMKDVVGEIDADGDRRLFSLEDGTRDVYFRAARDRCHIHDLHFHDTRATALTRFAKKIAILDLAKMSGHRDHKSLQIYYRPEPASIAAQLD